MAAFMEHGAAHFLGGAGFYGCAVNMAGFYGVGQIAVDLHSECCSPLCIAGAGVWWLVGLSDTG